MKAVLIAAGIAGLFTATMILISLKERRKSGAKGQEAMPERNLVHAMG